MKLKLFGIKIDKLYKGSVLETKEINAVGINKQDVGMFLKSIYDNSLEPKDLKDIKEEYVNA